MQNKNLYVITYTYDEVYGERKYTVAAADIVEAIHMVYTKHQIEVEEVVKVERLYEGIIV